MVTAHVPLRNPGPETEQPPEAYAAKNPFDDLGARLVKLGMAMQTSASTVSELQRLAYACGLTLKIRAVEDARE